MRPPCQRLGWRVEGGGVMALTLNSKIGDLVLAIGELIVASDGKTTTVELEIPDQDFYLEIAVKLKGEETKMEPNKEVQDDTTIQRLIYRRK